MCRVFGFSQLQFCLGVMGGKRKSNDGTSAASGKAKAIKNDSTASAVNHEYVKLFEDWLLVESRLGGGRRINFVTLFGTLSNHVASSRSSQENHIG